MAEKRFSLLRRVSILDGISNQTLSKMARFARFLSFRRGQQIFAKNTAGECLYVLVSGRVKIYSNLGTRSKTLALLEPGDFFGEMALLGDPIRSASARSILDSELLVLDRKDFQKFLQEDDRLAQTVLKTLCQRLRQADLEIERLSFQNVLGRTAMTLMDLESKYGKRSSEGVLIDLELSQQELADLIGTAREMASRALSRLKKLNAIDFESSTGKVILLDHEKLHACICH